MSEYGNFVYLKEEQAAEILKVSKKTLQNLRFQGRGPRFFKPSPRIIRYREDLLRQWMEGQQ